MQICSSKFFLLVVLTLLTLIFLISQQKYVNEEQIITGDLIDGAMGSLGGGWVRKLLVVCLHNNAIVARGILVIILHNYGTPEPGLSTIYIVSSVGTSISNISLVDGATVL